MKHERKHVLQECGGERAARHVIGWVNSRGIPPGSDKCGQFEKFLDNLVKLSTHFSAGPEDVGKHFASQDPPDIECAFREVNATIRRYMGRPEIGVFADGVMLVHWLPNMRLPDNKGTPNQIARVSRVFEMGRMVEMALKLAEQGLLERIKRCQRCQRCFYANFKHQRFCSSRCQESDYKSTDEWRAGRREYMRDYRQRKASGGRVRHYRNLK